MATAMPTTTEMTTATTARATVPPTTTALPTARRTAAAGAVVAGAAGAGETPAPTARMTTPNVPRVATRTPPQTQTNPTPNPTPTTRNRRPGRVRRAAGGVVGGASPGPVTTPNQVPTTRRTPWFTSVRRGRKPTGNPARSRASAVPLDSRPSGNDAVTAATPVAAARPSFRKPSSWPAGRPWTG